MTFYKKSFLWFFHICFLHLPRVLLSFVSTYLNLLKDKNLKYDKKKFGRGNTQRGSCVFFKGWIEERTISFPHNNGTFTSTLNRGCAVDGDIIWALHCFPAGYITISIIFCWRCRWVGQNFERRNVSRTSTKRAAWTLLVACISWEEIANSHCKYIPVKVKCPFVFCFNKSKSKGKYLTYF